MQAKVPYNTQAWPGSPSLAGVLTGSPHSLCLVPQCSSIWVDHFKTVLKIQARCEYVPFWKYLTEEESPETTGRRWRLKSLSKEQTPWRAITLPVEHTQCFPLCCSVTRRWSCSKQARPLLCAYHMALPGSNVAHAASAEERAVRWTKRRQGHRQGDEPCPAAQDFVPEVAKSTQHEMQFTDVLNTHSRIRQVFSLHYSCIILIFFPKFF